MIYRKLFNYSLCVSHVGDYEVADKKKLQCGLIMPISSIDGCSADHWNEVKSVITEAIESINEYEFIVSLVSDSDESGVIQKRIVQNVYSADIVVCDVSGKNPNVMFELGMRLAFDKPTVIVKDDKTDYSFDTGVIEHIGYPRDLRFSKIVLFKDKLAEKVKATYKKSLEDSEHSTFLKNFGKFQVANLNEDVVSSDKLLIGMISDLQSEISDVRRTLHRNSIEKKGPSTSFFIRKAIKSWVEENSCKVTDLFGNEEFYDYAEKEIDARRLYDSRIEFIDAVDTQLKRLST
jgi:nucleoside 2-deoxyribosyltransferase